MLALSASTMGGASLDNYSAVGDGSHDDTESIQDAFDVGGLVVIPPRPFLYSATLTVTKPIWVLGMGDESQLVPHASLGATTDSIHLVPGATGKRLYRFERFAIKPVSGTPGQHGVHVDLTDASAYLPQFGMYDVNIYQLGGNAFRLTNPTNVDGYFCSEIVGGLLYGGLYFERAGDSTRVHRTTLTGSGIGIEASFVLGAAQTAFTYNNITNEGGAVLLHNGDQVYVAHNQIEQRYAYTGSESASVVFKGDTSAMNASVLHKNNCNVRDFLPYCFDIQNATDTIIGGRGVLNCATARKHVNIGASSTRTTVTAELVPRVDDAGGVALRIDVHASATQTYGPPITVTSFSNSWVSYDTTNSPVRYTRNEAGMVVLEGRVKDGTTTPGTVIFTLPAGFRPSKAIPFAVQDNAAGTWHTGSVLVTATGEVQIFSGSNTVFGLGGIAFKAAL